MKNYFGMNAFGSFIEWLFDETTICILTLMVIPLSVIFTLFIR